VPTQLNEISCDALEILEAKQITQLNDGDTHIAWFSGGGGYGDPLKRDPQLVAADVRIGLCSPASGRDTYAVALTVDGEVDRVATQTLRNDARTQRLALARPVADLVAEVGIR
jgi:N-methylhydantoinase B